MDMSPQKKQILADIVIQLRSRRGVALAAVTSNGFSLGYASEELCADREVVLAAVTQDGKALQLASEELRADREVVMAAVKQDRWALRLAPEELRADPMLLSWAKLSRAQSLWRQLRENLMLNNIGYYWLSQSMKAQLDEDGKALMLGSGAKRLRDEYESW